MEPAAILAVVAIVISAGASFFFALAETALFSLSKWQVRQLAERSPRKGGVVAQLLSRPQDLLAIMVLGNMFATAAMLVVAFWMALRGYWEFIPTTFAFFGLVLFGCEVVPKTLAVRRPEKWAILVATPLKFMEKFGFLFRRGAQKFNEGLMRGLTARMKPQTGFSSEEYQELLELAYQQGALDQTEKEIILQIISLERRTVRDVMKPRSQMACISDELSIEEMIAAAKDFKHRRLPIYDETPDTIVGILNTRALLLDPHVDLAEAIELPSFVPESMNLFSLLKSLQRQQRGMAIVLDEFGGTAGIVTTEDILIEMIGKVRPELESDRFVLEKLGPGRWRVAGATRLDDFRREYPPIGYLPEVETMGGMIVFLLNVVPAPGEFAVFRGLKLTAVATDERRVRELLVEVVK